MKITVSTITPVYNGEKYLTSLVEALNAARILWESQNLPLTLQESIFVIDAAIDNSKEVLEKLNEAYPWIKIITLSRNFGQHAATSAGICHSTSEWIVTLDEDMQHDPEKIISLFKEQSKTGADVVYANAQNNIHGHNSWRDFSSKSTKRLLSKFSKTPEISMFNSFRLVRGSIARSAASASSSQTYFDIALTWFTNRFSRIVLEMHDSRYQDSKSSGYNLMSLIRHARKLILSSDINIASYGLLIGVIAILIAIATITITLFYKYFFPETIQSSGWASTVSLITFFGGITITLVCLALQYVSMIAINQLGKPTFFTIDRESDAQIKEFFDAQR